MPTDATRLGGSRKLRAVNFKLSTGLYRLAMSYNRGLDRDKDGIACEKA
jgi:Excalibur calcium-binding domain